MGKDKKYVVFEGRQPGIYETWAEAASNVNGYSGAVHQSFKNEAKAENLYQEYSENKPASSVTSTVTGNSYGASSASSRTKR